MFDRTGVGAVQQQNYLSAATDAHLPVDEVGRQRGGGQPSQSGVGHGEIQVAGLVRQAVTGEVQEQQVLGSGLREEVLYGFVHRLRRLVEQCLGIEAADFWVAQHAS